MEPKIHWDTWNSEVTRIDFDDEPGKFLEVHHWVMAAFAIKQAGLNMGTEAAMLDLLESLRKLLAEVSMLDPNVSE